MSPKIARKSENKRRSAVLESKLQEFEIGKIFNMFLEENNNIRLIRGHSMTTWTRLGGGVKK